MKSVRNITEKLFAGLMMMTIAAPVLAGSISFSPEFGEERFAPADKLHAECLSNVHVGIDTQGEDITSVYMQLAYDENDLEIVGVDSQIKELTSSIGYDMITVEYIAPKGQTVGSQKLFTVDLKSQKDIATSVLHLEKGSHYINANGEMLALDNEVELVFESVPECEPDVVAPSISLVTPKTNKEMLPLDAAFVFAIKDMGKGVDIQTLEIIFDGEKYKSDSQYIKWNGEYLAFYPKNWLPVDKEVTILIKVSDSQQYGGANVLEKEFTFHTAAGMLLENNVSPNVYRNIVNKSEQNFATAVECRMMKQAYAQIDTTSQDILAGVMDKLSCDMSNLDMFIEVHDRSTVQAATLLAAQEDKKVSVFTVLGWVLLSIVFVLKLHYYVAYRKHKKLLEQHIHG